MTEYTIGIDAGGTKTEAVLCDDDCHVIARCIASSGNPNDIGTENAAEAVRAATAPLLSGVSAEDITAVFSGCAGSNQCREAYTRAVAVLFSENTAVTTGSDAANLLSCGLFSSDGCGVIAGTGSGCFVRRNHEIRVIGGWGYLLDDNGSGYAIGRDGIVSALRERDGRDGKTLLTETLTETLGKPPYACISEIYRQGKPYIASAAVAVFRAAAQGDAEADRILKFHANALAELIETAARSFSDEFSVVLGGGILMHNSVMTELLQKNVTSRAKLFLLPTEPVFGAVCEARSSVGKLTGEAERQNFIKTYEKIRKTK